MDRRHSSSSGDRQIQESLSACWKEGVTAQILITVVDNYLIPLAVFLGATTPQIGLLVAVPNLLSSLAQLVSVRAVRFVGNRHKLLMMGLFIQALFVIPVGILSYTHWPRKLFILTVFIAVYKVVSALIGPAWGSMVSEYLPADRRGQYFGWRSRICGLASVINVALWGVFLYYWKRSFDAASAFLVMFAVAGAARFISLYYMSRMMDLPFQSAKEDDFTFWMFIRRFRESNFVKFVIYVASITFATHLAAPFFSVYMLETLHFNYLQYMAVTLASLVAALVTVPLWGRHADVVGNARILRITSFLVPIIPILWIFPRSVPMLVLVELFAGFVWGGFNLCAVTFIFDAVSPGKRIRCLAYFGMINGVAIFAGSVCGGYLAGHLPPLLGSPLLTLFLISGLARMAAHFLLSEKFKEVRSGTHHVRTFELFFSVVGLKPMVGRASEEINVVATKAEINFRKRP